MCWIEKLCIRLSPFRMKLYAILVSQPVECTSFGDPCDPDPAPRTEPRDFIVVKIHYQRTTIISPCLIFKRCASVGLIIVSLRPCLHLDG